MARPNYSRDKQQRDMAKKRKKEEKLQRKTERKDDDAPIDPAILAGYFGEGVPLPGQTVETPPAEEGQPTDGKPEQSPAVTTEASK